MKVLAEGGVLEALDPRGVATDRPKVDAAVVGWTNRFDFDTLAATATAARESKRLIGTNEDPTHPTPKGLVPGSGALLAAVATASGLTPEIAGKPHAPMAALMQTRFGFSEKDPSVVLVGDQRGHRRAARRAAGRSLRAGRLGCDRRGRRPTLGAPFAARAPDLPALVERRSSVAERSACS